MPRHPTAGQMLAQHITNTARPSTTFADIARFIGGTLLFVGVIALLIAYAWLAGA